MNAKSRLHSALENLLEKRPIDQISVLDIAAEADVSRQTFYRLYADKFELLSEYFVENYATLFTNVSTSKQVNEATFALLSRLASHKTVARNMFFSKDGFALKSFFRDLCVKTDMAFWESSGVDVDDVLIAGAIRLYAYGTSSLLLEWIKAGMPGDIKELADQFALALPAVLVAPNAKELLLSSECDGSAG